MKKIITPAFLALGIILQPHLSQALVAQPDLFGLDFRFSNPGARANAMGGAFIGLADDASAAYTNPAGLTVLTRSELSMEYKQGTYTTVITDFAPQNYEYDKGLGGMSFVSFAYPQDRATITIFRHNMINTESDFIWHDLSTYHSVNHVRLNGLTYGIGLGYKVLDSLSVGLTVNSTQMEYLSSSIGYEDDPSNWGPTSHPQHISNINRSSGSDTDEHFTVSMLWNVVDEFNLGLVYRQGPKYTFTYNYWEWDHSGTTTGFKPGQPLDQDMKVPDVYGIGLSYNLPFGLTVNADADYIKYSQIYQNLLWDNRITLSNGDEVTIHTPSNALYMDDIWEYHAGMEYVFEISGTPVALRGGYFFKPAIYFKSDSTTPPGGSTDFTTLDWSKDDDHIYSAGLGFVIGENVQIDIAGMFGDYTTEGILSLVYRLQ